MMNRYRLWIKVFFALTLLVSAVYAVDGNVSAEQLDNFKEIVNIKLDGFDKRLGDFSTTTNFILAIIGLFLTFFGVIIAYVTYQQTINRQETKEEVERLQNEAERRVHNIEGLAKSFEMRANEYLEKMKKSSKNVEDEEKKALSKINDTVLTLNKLSDKAGNLQDKITNDTIDAVNETKVNGSSFHNEILQMHEEIKTISTLSPLSWRWCTANDEQKKILQKFENSKSNVMDKHIFIEMLFQSLSLDLKEKMRVIREYPRLNEWQYYELIKTFKEEREKWIELKRDYQDDVLQLHYQMLKTWMEVLSDVLKWNDSEKTEKQWKYLFDPMLNNPEIIGIDETQAKNMSIIAVTDMFSSDEKDNAYLLARNVLKKGDSEFIFHQVIIAVLLEHKKYEEALEEIKKASEKYPEEAWLYKRQGNIYFYYKMYIAAEKSYKILKQLAPKDPILLEYMELLIVNERYEEALSVFDDDVKFRDKRFECVFYWLLFIIYVCLDNRSKSREYMRLVEKISEELEDDTGWKISEIEEWVEKSETLTIEQKEEINEMNAMFSKIGKSSGGKG